MEKRIYSLNLLTFIELYTGRAPKLVKEDNLWFGIYPEDEEIQEAINEFHNPTTMVNLHKFLNGFRSLKSRMR